MMNMIRFCTLTLALCFIAWPVMAQQSIAIVDVDRLLSDSEAGKSVQSQHTKKREGFQKEFTALENKLMTNQKNLVSEKDSLSPEEFTKKREALQKELQETGRLFQKRRNALDKGLADAFKTLRKVIIETTAEISQEKKFDLVITRESVVIVDKKMDITEEVLSRMNKKVTSIPLSDQ